MNQYYDYNFKLAVQDRLFTPHRGVKLLGGLWKDVFDNNREYLKKLSVDGILYWFRRKRGVEAPGQPYTGHFEDNIKGQTAGLFLMGAGNSLRWEEDPELRDTLNVIVDCVEASAEPDGFILPIDKKEFPTKEYPHYVRIWMNYGLGAAALSGHGKAYGLLRRWTDWFNASKELPIIRYLCLSFQGVVASTYVYTTPVGIPPDIEVTKEYYEEPWRLAQFIFREKDAIHVRKQPGYEPHPHGTELESFEGYLDLYRATGAYYYLNAVEGALELYKRDWQHPGGGIVMCEFATAYPGCNWIRGDVRYNELCCTSFWIGLNQRLHRLFPDAEEYAAEIEKSIYNIAIANQDKDAGIRYFALLEGQKQKGGEVHCCCGVGTKIFGSLPEYVYTVSPGAISVDCFAPSEIIWERPGGDVTIKLDTDMPYGGAVKITVSAANKPAASATDGSAASATTAADGLVASAVSAASASDASVIDRSDASAASASPLGQFALRARVPGWCASPVPVYVNGEKYADAEPGSYQVISRMWSGGDTVSYDMPLSFRYKLYSGGDEIAGFARYSFEYGPLLYSVCGPLDGEGLIKTPFSNPDDFLAALIKKSGLEYEIGGMPGYAFRPYFAVEDEEFTAFPLFAAP